jgi:phosphoribosylglycinamide formyltransferase-1
MKRIVIFASGSGTNAENIIKYFQEKSSVNVVQVLTNNKDAKVTDRSKLLNVNCLHFNKNDFHESDMILKHLISITDYIILAGFLWKVPQKIIDAFPNKIINIHPALLPKYGGKGMYGSHIHKAIVLNKEKETGITIHYVNENYDEGAIIFQKSVQLDKNDVVDDVAKKIHHLEMANFPRVIEKVILSD